MTLMWTYLNADEHAINLIIGSFLIANDEKIRKISRESLNFAKNPYTSITNRSKASILGQLSKRTVL